MRQYSEGMELSPFYKNAIIVEDSCDC